MQLNQKFFFLNLILSMMFLTICKTPMPELSSEAILSKKNIISVRWTTNDFVLAKVFPEVFPVPSAVPMEISRPVQDLTKLDLPDPDVSLAPKPKPDKILNPNELPRWDRAFELTGIENLTLVVRSESQRPFYSVGLSLLALTMLYYGTMESEAELVWTSNNESLHRISFLTTSETIWAPMPFYIGTGSTIASPILRTNQYPTYLQKYCVLESPSKIRETFDQTKEEICRDYENFLRRLLISNYDNIYSQLKEWEKANQDWFQP